MSGKNVLVVKQVYGSLQDSYFSDLLKAISVLGLDDHFTHKVSPLRITCDNGKVILFRGLDDVEKIKGITAPNGQIDHYTVEEITETKEESINQLQFRARGGGSKLSLDEIEYIKTESDKCKTLESLQSLEGKRDIFQALGFDSREDFVDSKKTMTGLFNPVYKEHWVYERFFVDENGVEIFQIEDKTYHTDSLYIMHSDHWDNQFLTYDDHMKYEGFRFINLYYYMVYCQGNWGILGDRIFDNWSVGDLSNVEIGARKKYYGMDYGWNPDPFACVSIAIVGRKICVLREIGGNEAHTRAIASSIKPMVGDNLVICDNSENRTTSELCTLEPSIKINARKVIKRRGDVNSSNLFCIQWLRFFEIVIDKRCTEFIKEIERYSWDEDDNGKKIAKPKDGDDHFIQALFYALNDVMEKVKPTEFM